MTSLKNTSIGLIVAYSVLAVLWIYTFYVSVLAPPFFSYFTVDENFIADSGVFLWYGNTPRCLDWPATPSLLTFFLMFGIAVAGSIVSARGQIHGIMSVFEQFDLQAYQYFVSRETFLIIGRSIQLVEVGIILVFLIRFLYKQRHRLLSDISRGTLTFIIITSYVVWFNAPVLRPEALSGSLFFYILARILFTDHLTNRQVYFLAGLFGIVLAERLLFVFVTPILVGGVYFLSQKDHFKAALRFIFLTILTFLVFCPFILTDPLVVLKSFVGGIMAKMNDKPMETLFNYEFIRWYFQNPVNYLVVFLGALGGWVLLKQRSVFYYIVIGNWLFFLFLVLRSAKIYDTHVLPAGILILFAVGLGVSFLAEKAKSWGGWVATGLSVIVIISNVNEYMQFQKRSHTVSNIESAYHWIYTLPIDSRLLVHPELEFYLPKTKENLIKELGQNQDTTLMIRKLNYLLGSKAQAGSSETVPLVTRSFAFEDERLYEIQYQLLLKYSDRFSGKRFNYDVYLDNVELASHSVKTEEALIDFKAGRYDYLVTDMQLDNLQPIKTFSNNLHGPIYCYKAEK
jgi:hypothetical protein